MSTFDARRPEAGGLDGLDREGGAPTVDHRRRGLPVAERTRGPRAGFRLSTWSASNRSCAFTGANLPLLLKGFARITSEGAYANAYACDLNATGFFPGLNDVTPIIVDAATPGNRAPLHTEVQEHGQWLIQRHQRVGARPLLELQTGPWLGVDRDRRGDGADRRHAAGARSPTSATAPTPRGSCRRAALEDRQPGHGRRASRSAR